MLVLKCKMCGGDIKVIKDQSYGTCDSCGSMTTLPTASDERSANLFNRANHFRRLNDFDRALAAYESLLAEEMNSAEAHWGAFLCRYGIEYVEDPGTHSMIPTCHRAQLVPVLSDPDYLEAVRLAPDAKSRNIYEQEAAAIADIHKGILGISQKEAPYDVFLCYKEADDAGDRTKDSVLAQEIYYELQRSDHRAFFARITLEDKLGSAYEPYIFCALNSAQVMLAIGTKPEHFNAVWVKNEWSRFLQLMKEDKSRLLIPCYQDMDAYDLPDELSYMQALDMGKIGFMQDLLRGVQKVLDADRAESAPREGEGPEKSSLTDQSEALIERALIVMEDGDWEKADELLDLALNADPKNARAYIVMLMVELKVPQEEALAQHKQLLTGYDNYLKALRFATPQQAEVYKGYELTVRERVGSLRMDVIYDNGVRALHGGKYEESEAIFQSISMHRDASRRAAEARERREEARKRAYDQALEAERLARSAVDFTKAADLFRGIGDNQDAAERAGRLEEIARKKRNIRQAALIAAALALTACIVFLLGVVRPSKLYQSASELFAGGEYPKAAQVFSDLGDYRDSVQMASEAFYRYGLEVSSAGAYWEVEPIFSKLGEYKDSVALAKAVRQKWIIQNRERLSAESDQTVGVKSDGTVVATGKNDYGELNVSGWHDIVAVASGTYHTVGLKSDGTVVAVGSNEDGQCNVSDWRDIVSISADYDHTVGLKSDGTVVLVGDSGRGNVSEWRDIVQVSAGGLYTASLKSDGTADARGIGVSSGLNPRANIVMDDWRDIVAISTGGRHAVGLKSDGTVVAVGEKHQGQCDVQRWTDIVAVCAGFDHTVGLKADGTVVATGDNDSGACEVGDWRDIVEISAGSSHTVGLKSDGTVVTAGYNGSGQCSVGGWRDMMVVG